MDINENQRDVCGMEMYKVTLQWINWQRNAVWNVDKDKRCTGHRLFQFISNVLKCLRRLPFVPIY